MARRDTNGNANGSGGGPGSRSASNSAFARTSFLYGGNAAYVEQLQDGYLRDPAALDPSWREFFAQMNDDSAAIAKSAQGSRWKRTRPAGRRRWRTRFGARRQLDGSRDADRRQARGESRRGRSAVPRRAPTRDPRFGARADDDPCLSHTRSSPCQSRPAWHRAPERSRGVASGCLWVHGGRLQPENFHRWSAWASIRDHSRNAEDPAPHLLRHHWVRIHAYLRSG